MRVVLLMIALNIILPAFGQHEGHKHNHKKDTVKREEVKAPAMDPNQHNHGKTDTIKPKPSAGTHDHGAAVGEDHHGHGGNNMSHAFSKNLSMNRNGSGTGWLPDNAPMYGYMFHGGDWMYMLHGNVFLRYNKQDLLDKGSRGDEKFDAPNWFMFMGQRPVGQKGLFRFSTMVSLDAAIAGGSGYPLLFQTGESYKGDPLIDRQHPHDLFS
ncbi:MAG TPA: hypothetical protein VGD26_04810, partial [Chitinophagaceae bacterium]